jgi:hypothetical protein
MLAMPLAMDSQKVGRDEDVVTDENDNVPPGGADSMITSRGRTARRLPEPAEIEVGGRGNRAGIVRSVIDNDDLIAGTLQVLIGQPPQALFKHIPAIAGRDDHGQNVHDPIVIWRR